MGLLKPRAITVDGERVVYRVAGRGPVLLLVHGMAGSSVTWRHVMPALARRFTVLAPDLLGQGQSVDGVAHYPHCEAPERFVEVLVDFIDSTKPARLLVRGHALRARPATPDDGP